MNEFYLGVFVGGMAFALIVVGTGWWAHRAERDVYMEELEEDYKRESFGTVNFPPEALIVDDEPLYGATGMSVGELRHQIENVPDSHKIVAITWEDWRNLFHSSIKEANKFYGNDVFILIGHEDKHMEAKA